MVYFIFLVFSFVIALYLLTEPVNLKKVSINTWFVLISVLIFLFCTVGYEISYYKGMSSSEGCFESRSEGRNVGVYFLIDGERYFFKTSSRSRFNRLNIEVSECYELKYHEFMKVNYLIDYELIKED